MPSKDHLVSSMKQFQSLIHELLQILTSIFESVPLKSSKFSPSPSHNTKNPSLKKENLLSLKGHSILLKFLTFSQVQPQSHSAQLQSLTLLKKFLKSFSSSVQFSRHSSISSFIFFKSKPSPPNPLSLSSTSSPSQQIQKLHQALVFSLIIPRTSLSSIPNSKINPSTLLKPNSLFNQISLFEKLNSIDLKSLNQSFLHLSFFSPSISKIPLSSFPTPDPLKESFFKSPSKFQKEELESWIYQKLDSFHRFHSL